VKAFKLERTSTRPIPTLAPKTAALCDGGHPPRVLKTGGVCVVGSTRRPASAAASRGDVGHVCRGDHCGTVRREETTEALRHGGRRQMFSISLRSITLERAERAESASATMEVEEAEAVEGCGERAQWWFLHDGQVRRRVVQVEGGWRECVATEWVRGRVPRHGLASVLLRTATRCRNAAPLGLTLPRSPPDKGAATRAVGGTCAAAVSADRAAAGERPPPGAAAHNGERPHTTSFISYDGGRERRGAVRR
jgi:hypothetical protein